MKRTVEQLVYKLENELDTSISVREATLMHYSYNLGRLDVQEEHNPTFKSVVKLLSHIDKVSKCKTEEELKTFLEKEDEEKR